MCQSAFLFESGGEALNTLEIQKSSLSAYQPLFGNATSTAIQASKSLAAEGVGEIRDLGISTKLDSLIRDKWGMHNLKSNPLGLSLEDWATRIGVAIAVYLPFSINAAIRDDHKAEIISRSVLLWLTTIGVYYLGKSEKFGVNSLLNVFMQPKVHPEPKNPFKRWLNNMKLDINYFDILKRAGIEFKGSDRNHYEWARLQGNKTKKLQELLETLKEQKKSGKKMDSESVQVFENLPKFLRRSNLFRLLQFGFLTALTIFFVGILVMDIVYKYFAVLDKDFDKSVEHGFLLKAKHTESKEQKPESKALHTPLIHHKVFYNAAFPYRQQPATYTTGGHRFNLPTPVQAANSNPTYPQGRAW